MFGLISDGIQIALDVALVGWPFRKSETVLAKACVHALPSAAMHVVYRRRIYFSFWPHDSYSSS